MGQIQLGKKDELSNPSPEQNEWFPFLAAGVRSSF